ADSTTQLATTTSSTSASALYDVSAPTQNSDITQSQIIQAAIGVSVTVLIIGICVLYCYLYGRRMGRVHTALSPTPRNVYSESVKRLEESSSETRRRFYEGEVNRPSSFDSTQLAGRPSFENPTGAGSGISNVGSGGADETITTVGGQNVRIGNSSLACVNIASEYISGVTPSLSSIELQANPIEVN
ncbi:5574_t:CDS:1, partial [Acaulospora colombiana]